ncbi:MAG: hypothetical protein NUV65_00865 [Candidatus Roizmanbacteria bacterium]|nr:hypothetical protein [Candidatus Roizmanbacteria bacterium]
MNKTFTEQQLLIIAALLIGISSSFLIGLNISGMIYREPAQPPVFLSPGGAPDSLQCSSTLNSRCIEYYPKE